MKISIALSAMVLVIAGAMIQADDEKAKKISLSDCPKAVQKTLKKEAQDGKIIDVDVRTVDGEKIYESEIWFGDQEYDFVVRGDGLLLSKSFEGIRDPDDDEDDKDSKTPVSLQDLPKAVRKTLKRESRRGEIGEIKKVQEDDEVFYEAEVEFGEKEYEVKIARDGTLLSKVLEEDEGDDDDDDD